MYKGTILKFYKQKNIMSSPFWLGNAPFCGKL